MFLVVPLSLFSGALCPSPSWPSCAAAPPCLFEPEVVCVCVCVYVCVCVFVCVCDYSIIIYKRQDGAVCVCVLCVCVCLCVCISVCVCINCIVERRKAICPHTPTLPHTNSFLGNQGTDQLNAHQTPTTPSPSVLHLE